MNAAISRALEKESAQRFGNMRELRDAIENAARPPAPTVKGSPAEESFDKQEKRALTFS